MQILHTIRMEFAAKLAAVEAWIDEHILNDGTLTPTDTVTATKKVAIATQAVADTANDKHIAAQAAQAAEAAEAAEATDATPPTTPPTTGSTNNG
jgi:hypothetical protein